MEPSPDAALGSALRELRRSRGLSQAELAGRAGVQRKTIHQIETAKTDPRVGTLRHLLATLDVSVPELFERADELRSG